MTLSTLVRSFVFRVALGTSALYTIGCDASSEDITAQYCVKDNECKGERLCIDGVCQGGSDGGSGDSTDSNLCNNYCYVVSSCCESEGKSWSDECGSAQECLSYCKVMSSDQTFTKETQAMVSLHTSEGCCYFESNHCKDKKNFH